jgi:protein dithiol oxidoreductase (disulfide-forming)
MKAFIKPLAILALLVPFAVSINAQPALYVEGTHYEALPEVVRTADPNKVEVTEVFWYGCPHCYAFEPLIENWESGLQSDVAFVRSPGMWNALMEIHAQIYYVAEELGVLDKTHDLTFNAIHQQGNYLQTQEEVRALFATEGVDPAEFDKVWTSFGINSKVKKANTNMRAYEVRGVPSLIVNGKYRVSAGGAVETQADMLNVVNFLIEKERSGS